MTRRQTKPAEPADIPDERASEIAAAAAGLFLGKVLTHAEAYEHVGGHFNDLAKHLARTSLAYVENTQYREQAAEQEAAFLIGLEIGRRVGGAR